MDIDVTKLEPVALDNAIVLMNKNIKPKELVAWLKDGVANGYDVASVQSLLGHNSLDTTMIYVHMANPKLFNVKSPLDSLALTRH